MFWMTLEEKPAKNTVKHIIIFTEVHMMKQTWAQLVHLCCSCSFSSFSFFRRSNFSVNLHTNKTVSPRSLLVHEPETGPR